MLYGVGAASKTGSRQSCRSPGTGSAVFEDAQRYSVKGHIRFPDLPDFAHQVRPRFQGGFSGLPAGGSGLRAFAVADQLECLELPQGFADVPAHRRSQDFIALQYPFGVSFRVYAIPTNVPGRRRPNTADELFNNIRSSIANEKPDSGLRSGYGADRLRRRQVENAD